MVLQTVCECGKQATAQCTGGAGTKFCCNEHADEWFAEQKRDAEAVAFVRQQFDTYSEVDE